MGKKMTETDLMNLIRIEIQRQFGCHSFRTNVGKILMDNGKWFTTGLPKGHADIYGYRKDGKCFYIETKMHPRKPTKEQVQFLLIAIENNCAAGVAYSVEDAKKIVEWTDQYKGETIKWLKEQ